MGSFTEFNNFFMPAPEDPMNDVEKNISNNFLKMEYRANVPTFTSIPSDFETYYNEFSIGDRIWVNDELTVRSSFLLIAKSPEWGLIWRPIQAPKTPWITPPDSVLEDPSWNITPSGSPPFQFSLCNRGYMYWRGSVEKEDFNPTSNITFKIFNDLPSNCVPSNEFHTTLACEPIGSAASNTFRGGRVFVSRTGYISFRFWNVTSADTIYLDPVKFSIGEELYFGP